MGKRNSQLRSTVSSLKGVTLVELLIVIAMIGILSAGLISVINPVKQLQRGRDTQRKSDVAKIQQALELYRADMNQYPGSLPSCGQSLLGANNAVLLRSVPCDPKTGNEYTYNPVAPGDVSYTIIACLENTSDTGDGVGGSCPGGATGVAYTRYNP